MTTVALSGFEQGTLIQSGTSLSVNQNNRALLLLVLPFQWEQTLSSEIMTSKIFSHVEEISF